MVKRDFIVLTECNNGLVRNVFSHYSLKFSRWNKVEITFLSWKVHSKQKIGQTVA